MTEFVRFGYLSDFIFPFEVSQVCKGRVVEVFNTPVGSTQDLLFKAFKVFNPGGILSQVELLTKMEVGKH